MTLFNRYAAKDYFPGVANLNNIYMPLYDNANTTQSIWFADNPNLLAWVEWENYLMSGDVEHVRWLINEKQYLQKHYQMMETSKPGDAIPHSSHRIAHERTPYGYTGSNQIVGMDNSPGGEPMGRAIFYGLTPFPSKRSPPIISPSWRKRPVTGKSRQPTWAITAS